MYMKQEQQQQAQNLYFQTDLSKTEIASMLGISRRTMHYWAHDNEWDQIKKSAATMPSMLASNCYFIMAKMQEDILSEKRSDKAPTYQEVNALYKLTLTINKLQNRSPLNETLEMGTHFMEFVNQQSPEAADFIKPFIDGYITSRAKAQTKQFIPAKNDRNTTTETDEKEALLDLEDLKYWAENPASVPTAAEPEVTGKEETGAKQAPQTKQPKPVFFNSSPVAPKTDKPVFSNAQSLPKDERLLNRAQRRLLARTKAAA